jgi:histidyl-tRNA synthetase
MKVSIPKGTRDFNPSEMLRRNYILDTIRSVYKIFGYQQIETPAMENLTTLTGKYGDEGDQLLYKILNSRIYDSKKKDALVKAFNKSLESNHNSEILTERALRYDLTVPFARYVVMHRNEITFPFKRFQVQPVWRADRPQKGRYREFFQCDADVIGSNSLLNEVELVQIIDKVFQLLDLPVKIKLNNRKILFGIAELCGHPDKLIDLTVAIDKLEKIGKAKVIEELNSKGLGNNVVEKLEPFMNFKGAISEKINFLKENLQGSETGMKGAEEVEKIVELSATDSLDIDITLARGLNYYTGAIFEVTVTDSDMGSVCGGGRYDDLTGVFGLPDISGVGISFGIDRIYDVLLQSNNFLMIRRPPRSTQVMFINFGESEVNNCLPIANVLRENGIKTEIYPDSVKMKKQMAYANTNNIEWVVMIGSDEVKSKTLSVKNMETGEQQTITTEKLIQIIKG